MNEWLYAWFHSHNRITHVGILNYSYEITLLENGYGWGTLHRALGSNALQFHSRSTTFMLGLWLHKGKGYLKQSISSLGHTRQQQEEQTGSITSSLNVNMLVYDGMVNSYGIFKLKNVILGWRMQFFTPPP